MDDQNLPVIPPDLLPDAPGSADTPVNTVRAVDEAQLQADLQNEAEFGDSALRTAAESAASSATLGLSDFILANMSAKAKKGLQQRRELNPVSGAIGTGAGIVVPAILAPETLIGRALPATKAAKAGLAVEDLASKALASRLKSKAAQDIIAKSVGMGAEGALYGVGDLVSEASLGNADFNGENIVASAGAGALLGAGFGSAFGAVKATVPTVAKGIKGVGNKLGVGSLTDPLKAAEELTGLSQRRILTIQKSNPKFFEELPSYFKDRLQLRALDTADDLAVKNAKLLQESTGRIKKASSAIDAEIVARPGIAPSRAETYQKLLNVLDEQEKTLALTKNTSRADIRTIRAFREDVLALGSKNQPFNFKEFDELRRTLQGIKYKGGGAVESFKANVAERMRGESRKIIDDVADRVATANRGGDLETVAAELKRANKDFYTASILRDSMLSKASKSTLLKWGDIVEAAAFNQIGGIPGLVAGAAKKLIGTDLRRNAAVLLDIRKQQAATKSLISDSVSTFLGRSKRAARSLSLKSLTGSGFSMSNTQGAPKNKKEAFANVQSNLDALALNADLLPERLAKSTIRVAHAAPAISNATNETLVRAVQFLQAKIPKETLGASSMLFKREFVPSTFELAKFERYLQAVEHPLSVMDDLERGTIAREHVEAIKAVYPALYGEMQQTIMTQIAELQKDGKTVSYAKRLQLGVLLDIPTDESLEPQNIAGLQANFGPQQSAEAAAQSQAGTENPKADVNFAEQSETSVQRVRTRV